MRCSDSVALEEQQPLLCVCVLFEIFLLLLVVVTKGRKKEGLDCVFLLLVFEHLWFSKT